VLVEAGYDVLRATTLAQARELAAEAPDVALLDYLLPDGDGIELGVELATRVPPIPVALMTGMLLAPEESAICDSANIRVILKPFLADELRGLIAERLGHEAAKATGGQA